MNLEHEVPAAILLVSPDVVAGGGGAFHIKPWGVGEEMQARKETASVSCVVSPPTSRYSRKQRNVLEHCLVLLEEVTSVETVPCHVGALIFNSFSFLLRVSRRNTKYV